MISGKRFGRSLLLCTAFGLAACGGGGGGSNTTTPPSGGDPAPPTPLSTNFESPDDVTRFNSFGGFGAKNDDSDTQVGNDAAAWLEAEFEKDASLFLPALQADFEAGNDVDNRAMRTAHWNAMIGGDDQLRQRMVFALSQILVISDRPMGNQPLRNAHYMDILSRNAFGNYRDLLTEITYSPAMANYLTYIRNRKGDPNTGRMPDENYARELLQLFTLGLVELNSDGTPKTGTNDLPIELFDNDDIVGLARVFTGLSYKGSTFSRADDDANYNDLVIFEDQHSQLEKSFLGLTIPPNTNGQTSIDMALDHIFEHPNLAPFVCRQLIQRFTQSNPDPAYVQRVVNAFEAGTYTAPNGTVFGTNARGDLRATLAAILLDDEVHSADLGETGGKIREPVLRFVHWARAFDVQNVVAENERNLRNNAGNTTHLSQQAFSSPSVFNFYRPGFIAPGTESGAAGVPAPEFQIGHEGATVGYINFMTDYARNNTPVFDDSLDSFVPDYTEEMAIADNVEALADHLDDLLLAGRMSDKTRERMLAVIPSVPISIADPDQGELDRRTRVEIAVTMTVTDPAFTVWK